MMARAETLEEDILSMHDDLTDQSVTTARVKLREAKADNRKWWLKVTDPAKYSDKAIVGHQNLDLSQPAEEERSTDVWERLAADAEQNGPKIDAGFVGSRAFDAFKAGQYPTMEEALVGAWREQQARPEETPVVDIRCGVRPGWQRPLRCFAMGRLEEYGDSPCAMQVFSVELPEHHEEKYVEHQTRNRGENGPNAIEIDKKEW